jgi:hypothetical protein
MKKNIYNGKAPQGPEADSGTYKGFVDINARRGKDKDNSHTQTARRRKRTFETIRGSQRHTCNGCNGRKDCALRHFSSEEIFAEIERRGYVGDKEGGNYGK